MKVGGITKHGSQSIQFRVSSLKDLAVIINHFYKYPLHLQKGADFEAFKRVFDLMLKKEHLTIQGLRKIVTIKSSMNLGLSSDLRISFSRCCYGRKI